MLWRPLTGDRGLGQCAQFCRLHPLPEPESLPSRIPSCADLWLSLPFLNEVKLWVAHGVRIPIQRNAPTFDRENKFPSHHLPFICNKVQQMIRLEVIVVPKKTPKCFTALKTAPKGGDCPCKELRLVMVGTSLDRLYTTPPQRLRVLPFLSFSVPAGWYMASIDLSDYYLHFHVTQDSLLWLGFRLDGKMYMFAATIFGFKISAYVAAKTSLEVAKLLCQFFPSSSFLVWVDDFLVAAPSREILRHTLWHGMVPFLLALGFKISWPKSCLQPST